LQAASKILYTKFGMASRIYPGGFHAFEAIMPAAAISKRASAEIDEALKRALHR